MDQQPERNLAGQRAIVVFLWDGKHQRIVCAIRSRLAVSGLTALPRQSVIPAADLIPRGPNAVLSQEAIGLTQALQVNSNVLGLPEVCHDFFERAGCPVANVTAYGHHGDRISRRTAGAKCHKAHVIGVDHTWTYIIPTVVYNPNPALPARYGPNFLVHCTNTTHSQYKIPSFCVAITNGSESFVDRYNREGRHFHGQPLVVCANFAASCLSSSIVCQKGAQCECIHATIPTNAEMLLSCLNELANLERSEHVRRDIAYLSNEMDRALQRVSYPNTALQSAISILDLVFGGTPSHIAAEDGLHHYPRLGRNFVVRVYAPNFSHGAETDYASEQILVTAGSLRYRNQILNQRNDFTLSPEALGFYSGDHSGQSRFPVLHPHQNVQKIQHCAHFINKGICRNGQNCKFIHAVEKQPVSPPQPTMTADQQLGYGTPSGHSDSLSVEQVPDVATYGVGSQRVVARIRKHPMTA